MPCPTNSLSTPDSNLLWYLTGRPGLVFDKNAKYNAKTEAVGSGPYTVESFDSASKMVLKANAKYWGTAHKPATQNVVIRFLTDDNAAVNALKSVYRTLIIHGSNFQARLLVTHR